MEVRINIIDIEACMTAIEDGNPLVALEILQESVDNYYEELENVTESE